MKRVPATLTIVAFFVAIQIMVGIREGGGIAGIAIASAVMAATGFITLWIFFRITGRGK